MRSRQADGWNDGQVSKTIRFHAVLRKSRLGPIDRESAWPQF